MTERASFNSLVHTNHGSVKSDTSYQICQNFPIGLRIPGSYIQEKALEVRPVNDLGALCEEITPVA